MSSYGDVIIIFPYVYPISHSSPILSSHTIFLWSHHLPRFSLIFIIHPLLLPHLSFIPYLIPCYLPIYLSYIPYFYPFPIEISSQKNGSGIYRVNIPTFPYLWCIPYFSHTFPIFFHFYLISISCTIHPIFLPYYLPIYLSISIIYLIYLPYVLSIIYYLLSIIYFLLSIIYYLIHYLLCLPYIFHMFSINIW